MIITQLLPSMRRAGAESVVATFCKGLSHQGHKVHLIVLGGKCEYKTELTNKNIFVHELHLFNGVVHFYDWLLKRKIVTTLKKELVNIDPSIIHCHLSHSLLWLAASNFELKGKVFFTAHGLDPALNKKDFKNTLRKINFLNAVKATNCKIIAVSDSVKKYYENSLSLDQKIDLLPNPIDLKYFKKTWKTERNKNIKILGIGTLYPLKRFDNLLRAFSLFPSNLNVTLDIVGEGPLRRELELLADGLNIRNKVNFQGSYNDVRPFLHNASVLWHLSEREGCPMVILEAMASGLPIIATDAPGTNEIIKNKVNGFLVPPDDIKSVKKITLVLLKNKHMLKRIAKHGQTTVGLYDQKQIVKKLEAIYLQKK